MNHSTDTGSISQTSSAVITYHTSGPRVILVQCQWGIWLAYAMSSMQPLWEVCQCGLTLRTKTLVSSGLARPGTIIALPFCLTTNKPPVSLIHMGPTYWVFQFGVPIRGFCRCPTDRALLSLVCPLSVHLLVLLVPVLGSTLQAPHMSCFSLQHQGSEFLL